jgi:putative transposase
LTVLLASEGLMFAQLHAAESIGRPLGDDRFLVGIEKRTGRTLKPGKRRPKPSTRKVAHERYRHAARGDNKLNALAP